MEQQRDGRITQTYAARRQRQVIAIATAIALMLAAALLYRRPDLFGAFSKSTLVKVQLLIIVLFINFTSFNWRCPSCGRYLGGDIGKNGCRKCGVRLR